MDKSALLRARVQGFVRSFGLLAESVTPCGHPMSARDAHALQLVLECGRREEDVRHGDLQRYLGIDKSNVTRLVQRLEEAGLVRQATCPTDGRSRLLQLTDRGRRTGTSLEESSHKLFERMLKKIPEARRTQVLDCLSLLEEAARESIP